MEIINKEGKELETILESICEENNLSKDDFYYSYTTKKSGLFNKNNTITVTAYLKENILNYIKDYLNELLTNMGLDVQFETKIRDNVLFIKIYSSNNSVLIGREGNTLKALESIVRQKINTDFNIRPLVTLDIENYREKQQQRLERMAKRLARDVVKTKMEVHLENMNAYDRRIIHNALTNFKGVSTSSIGEEPNRHVIIKPE